MPDAKTSLPYCGDAATDDDRTKLKQGGKK
jgi:hypothetical protein